MVQLIWKTVWQLLQELNIVNGYHMTTIPHLTIYPRIFNTCAHIKTGTCMLIVAFPIKAKADEWINKI